MSRTFQVLMSVGAIALLSGCTAVFSDVKSTINYAFSQTSAAQLTPAEIAAFPYSAHYVTLDDQPRALLVLGYIDPHQNGSLYNWISGDQETVVTQNGRIIRTVGLDQSLVMRTHLDADPLHCFQTHLGSSESFTGIEEAVCSTESRHELDIESSAVPTSIFASSHFELLGMELINLPNESSVTTYKVEETITYNVPGRNRPQMGKSIFWLESDGHIVKSWQHIIPGYPVIKMTQVKWVGRDD